MFSSENTILIVIDIQGKLAQLMYKKGALFSNASKLIQSATLLDVPIIVTEQVPDKIGETIPEISKHFNDQKPIAGQVLGQELL